MQAARVARLLLSAPSASARRASSGRALVARASGRALHGDAVASGGRASDLVPIVYHEDYSMPVLPEGHRVSEIMYWLRGYTTHFLDSLKTDASLLASFP